MKANKIFSDVTSVSRGAKIRLHRGGLLNKDDTVVSWARLNPAIKDRRLTEQEAKQLILLEITRTDSESREEIVTRLVNYLTRIDREETKRRIEAFKSSTKKKVS